jgi:hypothetical protein
MTREDFSFVGVEDLTHIKLLTKFVTNARTEIQLAATDEVHSQYTQSDFNSTANIEVQNQSISPLTENVNNNAIVLMEQCVTKTDPGPTYERIFKPRNHKVAPNELVGKKYLLKFHKVANDTQNRNQQLVNKWFEDKENPKVVKFFSANFRYDAKMRESLRAFVIKKEPLLSALEVEGLEKEVRWEVDDICDYFIFQIKNYRNGKKISRGVTRMLMVGES